MFIAHADEQSLCYEGREARVACSTLYLDLSKWRCVKTRILVCYLNECVWSDPIQNYLLKL
jgi:hypothetical protein